MTTTTGDDGDEALLAVYVDAARTRQDRERAFATLVDRFEHRVYAICLRELGNRADAEDATQDTFLHLARKGHQFRGDSALSTFVYRIAVNACRDLQRRRGRRPQTPVADVAEVAGAAAIDDATAVDEQVEDRDTARAVGDALAQLDELSRTLIVLCTIEGMTYPEASEILEIPVGTIKSRVHRARARLAELLADTAATSAPNRDEREGRP